MNKLLALLGFDPAKHSVKVEMIAGLTTFLTMSYILAVNPLILGETGMDRGALFSATAVAALIATLVMAFYAKMPFALASGMGLNAFFAYTLVLSMGYTWEEALASVFFEGVVFILLTVFKVREAIVNAIPVNLRYSISVGIGLFIAYIGLKNGGIIIGSDATVTALAPWTVTSLLAAGGVLLGGALMALGIRGALFYTIVIMTVIGIPFGVTQLPSEFSLISMPQSLAPIAFHLDFTQFLAFDLNYYIVVFALLFMDLFDTLGTLIGASTSANMVDPKTGRIHGLNRALMADAIGTTCGALCGTNTVTTYVESATGIAEGGRTGLTSFTVALLFFVALFFSPLFLIIPSAATTPALVLVGVLMTKPIMKIDFSDFTEAVPCFITIITMPFTASISEGIVLGMLSYVIVKVLTGRFKDLSIVMYILAAFFVLKYIFN
ncbi:putative MFS transporter, AGZA family, xanthine/uracil permease [Xylanibacter ruminicola]|uniref:Putative MFS transporter, AGZA family, xanthine/uracil permease n=1 Tax=Xylanibacter ruminicola TaxID=839 RepID=A0A1H5RMG9_XYLRU|nr:NCS2 family permease [Xylanibacter ruminicola]SEF38928.1 putative MFS transporter, AGZA family, xanthine/uracil permease [Xylanibacter ruminicola]